MDNIRSTPEVKSCNTALVLDVIKKLPSATKNTVAKLTGLSVATCNTLLNELCASGELLEAAHSAGVKSRSAGGSGRPAKAYSFNAKYRHVLCATLSCERGERLVSLYVCDLLGGVDESWQERPERLGFEDAASCLKKALGSRPDISAVGLSVPAIVNGAGGLEYCDINELSGVPLRALLEEGLDAEVTVENDMNLMAYGFYSSEHPGSEAVAALSFFKGVCAGAGIVINGGILRGRHNFAGEISYLPMDVPRREIQKLMEQKTCAAELAGRMLAGVAAVISPQAALITGKLLDADVAAALPGELERYIPPAYAPEITFKEDASGYIREGLCALVLEKLNDPLKRSAR